MVIQDEGGTQATVERGVRIVTELLETADRDRATVAGLRLKLGLECGGSDGYSGITANPALGAEQADRLVEQGGTAVLSETPEIYGAEHLLTRRAVSRAVGAKLVARIRWWEEYTARNGSQLNNNPTPGNKAGGLAAVLEKSLGPPPKAATRTWSRWSGSPSPWPGRGWSSWTPPGSTRCR